MNGLEPLTDEEVQELVDLRPGEPYPPALMARYKLSPFRNFEPALVATCMRLTLERDAALATRPALDVEQCCKGFLCTAARAPGEDLCPFHLVAGADFYQKRMKVPPEADRT